MAGNPAHSYDGAVGFSIILSLVAVAYFSYRAVKSFQRARDARARKAEADDDRPRLHW
jgi:hypothetical protein